MKIRRILVDRNLSSGVLAALEIPVLKHGLDDARPQLRVMRTKNAFLLALYQNISDHFFGRQFTGHGFFLFRSRQVFGFHKGKIKPWLHGFAQIEMGENGCAQFCHGITFFGDAFFQYVCKKTAVLLLKGFQEFFLAGKIRIERAHAHAGFTAQVPHGHGLKAFFVGDLEGSAVNVVQVLYCRGFFFDENGFSIFEIGFSADVLPGKVVFFLKFRKRHSPSPRLDY